MFPIPLPSSLLARGLIALVIGMVIAGAAAFATYTYVMEHKVAPLQKQITLYEEKDRAKVEGVAKDSEAAAEDIAKKALADKKVADAALAEYIKRNGAAGAQRSCVPTRPKQPAVVGPLTEPPEGGLAPIPDLEVLQYQVLSDDGLYTAQKILRQVPDRSTPLEDGSLK